MSPLLHAEGVGTTDTPADATKRTAAVLAAMRGGLVRSMHATPDGQGYSLVIGVRNEHGSGLAEILVPRVSASKLLETFQRHAQEIPTT